MKLPTFRATTAPPRETGLVRADPQALTNTGDAEFRAIAGAGRAIQNVGGIAGQAAIQRKNLDNEAAAGRADARSIDALTEATNAINGQDFSQNTVLPDDPKKYYSGETGDILEFTTEDKIKGREEQIGIVNGRLETLSKAMGFRGEKARLAWLEGKKDAAREILTKVSNAKQNEYQTELFLGNARNAAANGDMEVSEQWIKLAEDSGLIGPKLAAKERKDNQELSIKSQASILYNAGEYQEARDLVAESPLQTLEKESLLNTINLIEERNERKTKDLNYQKDLAVNEEFVDLVMAKDLKPDTVKESRLDEKTSGFFGSVGLSQKSWLQYASDSYKDPPTKTSPSGFTKASDVVLDYAGFGIDKEIAYKRLLDSRHINREITDTDFTWAINHIRKPYTPKMANDIKLAIKGNDDAILRGWIFDKLMTTDKEKEKARSVNSELIKWIDSEIEQKREPTSEQMYQKSAQLRAQSPIDSTAPTPQSLRELGTKEAYEQGKGLGYWN